MDEVDIFEDALFTVFARHQPARGDPGSVAHYPHAALPGWVGEKGIAYRIADLSSANTKLFAHHQWDAGVYLADLLAEAPGWADARGRTVVELGAGTGLPALVAAAMGAKRTVVTDYPDKDIVANLEQNAAWLKWRAPHALPLDVRGLAWGEDLDVFLDMYGTMDCVIAADVLWVSSQHAALLDTVCALLARTKDARFLLAAGFHTGRPAIARFLDAAQARGLAFDEAAPHGGVYERSIFGQIQPYTHSVRDEHGEEDMGDIQERGQWIAVASFRWA